MKEVFFMKTLRTIAVAAILMMFVLPVMNASAQGPIQKRVNFWINVPFEISESNMILPAGDYVLYQILPNDQTLFALYKDDRTHPPIAMIRTVRIEYAASGYPGETRMLLDRDEERDVIYPVITGWNIPGMDGFEIISVTGKDHSMISSLVMPYARNKSTEVKIRATSSGFSE